MILLDLTTYFYQNVIHVIFGFFVVMFISFATAVTMAQSNNIYDEKSFLEVIKKCVRIGLLVSALGAIIGFLPTHDKMLKLKLSKITNETVTEENVNKGIDEVQRVIKKLEDKYLGE